MVSRRGLFIGNSYTACNDLPGMIASLARRGTPPCELATRMVVQGGVTLEWHYEQPETLAAIREGDWDFVALQEQSLRPVEDTAKMHEFGLKLHQEIREPGGETVLYMTWARQHLPEMQEKLTAAYVGLAEKAGAKVVPVGLAWQRALAAAPELTLHTEDQSHPNPTGTYLAACVFASSLFGAKPPYSLADLEASVPGLSMLSGAQAEALQLIAWEAAEEFGQTKEASKGDCR